MHVSCAVVSEDNLSGVALRKAFSEMASNIASVSAAEREMLDFTVC